MMLCCVDDSGRRAVGAAGVFVFTIFIVDYDCFTQRRGSSRVYSYTLYIVATLARYEIGATILVKQLHKQMLGA